jgi:hypothetical protein
MPARMVQIGRETSSRRPRQSLDRATRREHTGCRISPRQLPKALPPSARVSAVQIITPLVNDWIHDSHKM